LRVTDSTIQSLDSRVVYRIGALLGRLANGFQSDHGTRYHAVVRRMVRNPNAGKVLDNGYVIPDKYERDVALCGAKPGRRSVGWSWRGNASWTGSSAWRSRRGTRPRTTSTSEEEI
jgi:hypothetical protein